MVARMWRGMAAVKQPVDPIVSSRTPRPADVVNNYDELVERLSSERQSGKRIACTIGSFDVMHWGHVDYLREARTYGDVLVVGVDSDVAYEKYKRRPVFYPEAERQGMVASLRFANYVTLIEDVDEAG